MKTLVICSGGLDSVSLAHIVAHQHELTRLVSFNYGQRHSKELDFAAAAAERLGVAQQQLLVSDDWMQDNMPALTIEASRRGVSLKEFVGVDSPVDLCVHDEHDDEKLTRCLGFDVPDVRSDLVGIDIKYSRPPSPMLPMPFASRNLTKLPRAPISRIARPLT